MCMSDYLLGAKIKSTQGIVTVLSPSFTVAIPRNQNRVSLIISNSGTAALNFTFGKDTGSPNGIVLPINQRPLFFDFRIHGEIMQREIFAAGAANSTVTYWEGVIDDLANEIARLNIRG